MTRSTEETGGDWTCVDEMIVNGFFLSDHMPVHAVVNWNYNDNGRP